MALKQGVRSLTSIVNMSRRAFSTGKLIDLSVNDDGLATVTMSRLPVNSLNLDLLTEFSSVLTELEKNKSKGMILTSISDKVFSAGLDIMEMYKPKEDRAKAFWMKLQEVWMKLYGSSFPTVAVINGHSPAGGCLLAMSCEYRVMLNNFTIGLNETQLGIVAPLWFIATMKNTISTREAELALITGRLFKTDEALKIGLIDEIAKDKSDGIARATEFINRFETISPLARAYTKNSLRGADIEALKKNREQDTKNFVDAIQQPKVQQGLEFYLAMLKSKSEK